MRRILLVLATMLAAVLVASGVTLAAPLHSGGKITINDATFDETTQTTTVGTATPYPSEIVVSGLPGLITDVNVVLRGFSHTFPEDVDMLLIGPSGNLNAILMSDVGAGEDVRNKTLALDDQATDSLPDSSQITRGTFQPVDYDTEPGDIDTFPSAPIQGVGSALSIFNNTNPNGTWRLYVVDDANADVGQLRGWALEITTTS
jgi:subtilisin-like proprotein convertase family protein